MNDTRRKLLTEKGLGECWHDIELDHYEKRLHKTNRTFAKPDDYEALREKVIVPHIEEFDLFLAEKDKGNVWSMHPMELIHWLTLSVEERNELICDFGIACLPWEEKMIDTSELEIWKALSKCKCVRKVKGDWDYGDIYCNHYGSFGHFPVANDTWDYSNDGWKSAIWIPPLYDPIRPERSLWYLSGDIRWNWSVDQKLQFMLDARPDLAMAKAIIEQEGKKGEGDGAEI